MTGLFCFLRIQDLLVVMPSFLILQASSLVISKDMNISNQTIALGVANSI